MSKPPALPPLAAIRAFEAAARHESFTKAAAELGMTQAAVSYQVKLLEERVGEALFRRLPRKVELSETGKRLAPAVTDAFQRLNAAFNAIQENEGVLAITAVHTFATNWLVPRLGRFQQAHPEIAVRIDISTRNVDFTRENFDLGIRGGNGKWPGIRSHKLVDMEFTPLCSPDFLARYPLSRPEDALHVPRVDAHDEWWRLWFAAAGVTDPPSGKTSGVSLDVQTMVGAAAIAGQGIAILTPLFFLSDIAAGRLVRPFELSATDGDSYWVIYPEQRHAAHKIRAFRQWILAELASEGR